MKTPRQVLSDGRIMAADTDGVMREVVQLTYSIIADTELLPGLYQVGSGSSGAALTLVTMGALYLTAIASAAFMVKKPPLNFSGPISKNNINNVRVASNQTSYLSIISPLTYFSSVKTNIELTIQRLLPPKTFLGHKDADADISAVMRCRQFYLLWATFSPLVMVGMALAGTAKDMILEVFGSALPAVVTPSFAVGYVAAFSLFNLGGRLFWASFSDKYGQQNAFRVFSGLGFPLALILPLSVLALAHFTSIEFREGHSFAEMLAKFAMWTFLASSLAIVSIFGGACSTVPAFAAELFGRNVIDKVHGRLLTAAAFAGLCGPILVSQLRARAERRAVATILPAVDDQKFFDRFGVTKKETHALMKSNAITIKKVLEIAPDGTVDPSPTLYNSTLYVISAMFVVAGLTSRAICKVPASVFKVSKKDN